MATAELVLLPDAFMFGWKAPVHWPRLADHPVGWFVYRKFCHSVSAALPSTTQPARRRFAATVDSCAGLAPKRMVDPEVVSMSRVTMLSFNTMGTPWSGLT